MTTDFHAHAFPDELAPRAIEALNAAVPAERRAVLDGTVGALLGSMDRSGIERSVICSVATRPSQVDAIIRWSRSIASERIVPLGSVHPDCADPAHEVRKVAEAGLRGLKLHPLYQGFAADEPRMWPVYEAAARAGLLVLMHCGGDIAYPPDDDRAAPGRLLAVHRAFPELAVVAAHLGGWNMWDEVAETLAGTAVYLETSYTFCEGPSEGVERVLARHPVERILFGSDSPWREQAAEMELVRQAFPDARDRELVLCRNAERLLSARPGP